jgi:5-methylcytosine-specific restriction endonuclease McrA
VAGFNAICKLDDCDAEIGRSSGYGYCRPHYRAFAKRGDPYKRFDDRDCRACGITFQPARSGVEYACSEACREIQNNAKMAEYRAAHRDKYIAYNREWRASNPAYHSEYNKRWREENPEAHRAYGEKYRAENIDAIRRRFKEWEARNPDHTMEWVRNNRERSRETTRRRRARLKQVPTFEVTDRDIRRLLNRFQNACAYCNERFTEGYHIDHVLPVTAGGSNGVGNLVPACATCNVSKSNWFLSEWRYRDRLSRPLRRRASTHSRTS